MKTKIQIKTLWGKILFEFEKEDNSIKETLQEASLRGADLQGAYLQGAYLQGADLQGAYLKRIYTVNCILPEGELVVWKKLQNELIAKLIIPAKAKRVHAIGSRKCRFEFAKVEAIFDGKKKVKEGLAKYNGMKYIVGEIITPDEFDSSPLVECSHGIHAFITKLEAQEY